MQPTPSNVMVTSSHMVTSLDEECTTMPVHHIDTNHKLINNGQDEAFFANNKILVNTGLPEQQPISASQVNGDSATAATFEMSNMTKQQVSLVLYFCSWFKTKDATEPRRLLRLIRCWFLLII